MTVYAVRQGSCVNNFAIETAEINIEGKHHLLFINDSILKSVVAGHARMRFCQ
jgi:hypothetical protein